MCAGRFLEKHFGSRIVPASVSKLVSIVTHQRLMINIHIHTNNKTNPNLCSKAPTVNNGPYLHTHTHTHIHTHTQTHTQTDKHKHKQTNTYIHIHINIHIHIHIHIDTDTDTDTDLHLDLDTDIDRHG